MQSTGKDAAKSLLAHISRLIPHVDKYAHLNIAHDDLLQDLGWEYVGHVAVDPEVAHNGTMLTFPQSTSSWMLRGVPG